MNLKKPTKTVTKGPNYKQGNVQSQETAVFRFCHNDAVFQRTKLEYGTIGAPGSYVVPAVFTQRCLGLTLSLFSFHRDKLGSGFRCGLLNG